MSVIVDSSLSYRKCRCALMLIVMCILYLVLFSWRSNLPLDNPLFLGVVSVSPFYPWIFLWPRLNNQEHSVSDLVFWQYITTKFTISCKFWVWTAPCPDMVCPFLGSGTFIMTSLITCDLDLGYVTQLPARSIPETVSSVLTCCFKSI